LFKFPILEFVEETSKIMIMNEFELIYWFHLLERFLTFVSGDSKAVANLTANSVRLIFF